MYGDICKGGGRRGMLTSMEGGVRRKQTYEVELRRAIRKTGVGRGGRHAHYEIT